MDYFLIYNFDSLKSKYRFSMSASSVSAPIGLNTNLQPPNVLPIERSYPPIGALEGTVTKKLPDGTRVIVSEFPHGLAFQDHEIKRVIVKHLPDPEIARTQDGKVVIQQQGARGCTTACTTMLLADHGKPIEWELLQFADLGDNDAMIREIKKGELQEIETNVTSMEELRTAILKDGPAIVTVNLGFGGHVIIVDDISADFKTAILRDPYHGWQIEISGDTLRKSAGYGVRLDFHKIIQIHSGASSDTDDTEPASKRRKLNKDSAFAPANATPLTSAEKLLYDVLNDRAKPTDLFRLTQLQILVLKGQIEDGDLSLEDTPQVTLKIDQCIADVKAELSHRNKRKSRG